MSLVEELSQKTRFRPSKKLLGIAAAVLLVGCGGWYRYSTVRASTSTTTTTSTEYTVKKGTITIGSTADGSIQGNSSTILGFEVTGKIKEVFKKPGDTISVGEAIARIDEAQLRIDLAKAENAYVQAQLTYSKNINPLSSAEQEQLQKDLEISSLSYEEQVLKLQKDLLTNEQNIASAKKKLEQLEYNMSVLSTDNSVTLKQSEEAQKTLQDQQALYGDLFDALQKVKDLDLQTDKFMGFSQLHGDDNAAFESLISAKNTSVKATAQQLRVQIHGPAQSMTFAGYSSQDDLMNQANTLLATLTAAKNLASAMVDVMNNTLDGANLSVSQIDTYRSTFSSLLSSVSQQEQTIKSGIQGLLTSSISSTSTLDSAQNSLRDKQTSLQQQIDAAQQDLDFSTTQYELQKQQLEQTKSQNTKTYEKAVLDNTIKSNPLSSQEKDLYAAQVESSRLSLQEKENQIAKATLTSPVSGVILAINGNIGETAGSDFVTIGTKGYSYVLANISEDDIATIQAGQEVRITPKAADDITLTGMVYYVSSIGEADNNGVVTFPVFISYSTTDERVKTSMNVEIEFIRKTAENVMIIPIKAVFPYENTPHVKLADGTLRQVITGLSDGKQVEVISGLEVGDRILVTQ